MCGIAGLWHWFEDGESYPEALTAMLCQLEHRGPTDSGGYWDRRVGLAATRLAIFDPPSGPQPFSDQDSKHHLVFNGALYNHQELRDDLESKGIQFRSKCDTEVLLRSWLQWGPSSLARFNGMFAFAIYDGAKDQLILARDRFGQKPLYYSQSGEALVFASEAKAMLALDNFSFSWDQAKLASLFAIWTPLPDSSPFQGLKQVPPGGYLLAQPGRPPQICHYYSPQSLEAPPTGDLQEQLRHSLQESVRLRLKGDREVGVYLSGGLDSALLAALANQQTDSQLRTYSVSFEESPDYDESSEQAVVSSFLGTAHENLPIKGRDIVEHFPAAVFHAETPVVRTALTPMYLLSRLTRERGTEVVLTGEGADELFLGYDIFRESELRAKWPRLSTVQRREALASLYSYERHLAGSVDALFGLFEAHCQTPESPLFSHQLRYHNSAFALRLLHSPPAEPTQALKNHLEQQLASLPLVRRAQWIEIFTLLSGYLLSSQGDRAAMAHGVENRCPYLDPKLANLVLSLPLERLSPLGSKRILRESFAGLLPDSILGRAKMPYRSPGLEVFRKSRPDYLELVLSSAEIRATGLFEERFVSKLVSKVLDRRPRVTSPRESQTFLLLLSTQLLHRSFCKSNPMAGSSSHREIHWKV